jgi:hypothetical protein
MEGTKKILLEYLGNNNWDADSINKVKERIQDFKGIVAIRNRTVLFSESKDWRTDKSEAQEEDLNYKKKKGGYKKLSKSGEWKCRLCRNRIDESGKVLTFIHFHKEEILSGLVKYQHLIAA